MLLANGANPLIHLTTKYDDVNVVQVSAGYKFTKPPKDMSLTTRLLYDVFNKHKLMQQQEDLRKLYAINEKGYCTTHWKTSWITPMMLDVTNITELIKYNNSYYLYVLYLAG